MSDPRPGILERTFRFVLAKRWWVLAAYALLLGPSAWFAMQVGQDNAIDRLFVETDPDYIHAKEFEKVFGGGEFVMLLAEATDPYAPDVLALIDDLEQKIRAIPKCSTNSALSVFRKAKAGFDPKTQARELEAFMGGTRLFKAQGLVGDGFLSIPIVMDVDGPKERYETLSRIDAVVDGVVQSPAPLLALRKVGEPYVNDYLDRGTTQAGLRCFPFFGLFVIALCLGLYRSFRALLAFVITLGVNVAMAVGYVGLTGGTFTIVSAMVPMTILITCTATLVYIHSRFVERPPDRSVHEHQVFSLLNKFLACTASIFATAVGFAALAVSDIRPIREMGIWIAIGLVFTWIVVFTLFPALQSVLKTPTQVERKTAGQFFVRLASVLPSRSWRLRWLLVPGSLVLSALGAMALFGAPGLLAPMPLQTNPLEYVNHDTDLYKDTKRLEQLIPGLSVSEIMIRPKDPSDPQSALLLTDGAVIKGLNHFQQALEKEPLVGAAVGLPSVLRMVRYVSGRGDQLPEDVDELDEIDLASLLASDPMLARFVEPTAMQQTHVTVISKTMDYPVWQGLETRMQALWADAVATDPALDRLEIVCGGLGPLHAKVGHNLTPTLVDSFVITVAIIFAAFLIIFRNGAARLMAMIPSIFAILVMFGIMRLTGSALSVSTILIASTVLGTSENDQIHFFYHFLERKKFGTTEQGLRHTILIAGKPIFFATLINAGGFLAFALSDMPPMRQFGLFAALAFVLSMIADFTALPAALWMVFRDRPDPAVADDAPPPPVT